MKKSTILLFLLLVSKVCLGQSSKYSLQVNAGPDYYLSQYGVGVPEFPSQSYSAKLSYSASVFTYYQFKRKLAFGVGLSYARKDYQLNYNFRAIDSKDPLLPIRTIIQPTYVETPVRVKYNLVTATKYALVATTGLTPGFLLQTKGKTTYDDGHTTTRDYTRTKVNTLLLSLPLSLGVTYYFNSKIGLMVSPEFRYYFNKIDNQAFKINPVQLSFQVGTVIRF